MGIPDEELERIQERADQRLREHRRSALRWLSEWELIFTSYLRYSEVWGTSGGLTKEQITEMRVAYEEWSLYKAAYDKWEKHHDPETSMAFDRQGYIEKRRREIEEE